jgi:hypothetical protein
MKEKFNLQNRIVIIVYVVLCKGFACVAAIGNLSEQAGLTLKNVLGYPFLEMALTFSGEKEKEFPTVGLRSIGDRGLIVE